MTKLLGAILVATLFCAVRTGAATAEGPGKTVVYPTGVFPQDVQNVQSAVSKGGEVELEAVDTTGKPASFNFGPAGLDGGEVYLPVDVNLHGTKARGHMATIVGGFIPIATYTPIHFKISQLQFDQPADAAIFISASAGATIVDNVVNNVVGMDFGAGYTQGFGIAVNPGYSVLAPYVSGEVLIARNTVNGVNALQGYGILTANVDAEVLIDDNKVKNINLNGILVGGISKDATVVNNDVSTGAPQDPDFTAGNGILVGHARGGHFFILGNLVRCVNSQADGIAFVASAELPVDGSLVIDNEVNMLGSLYGGISLYDATSHVIVVRNTVSGSGDYALQVAIGASQTPASAIGNEFIENRLYKFKPDGADEFLDINAADTTLCRQPGTLINNGVNTQIKSHCAP